MTASLPGLFNFQAFTSAGDLADGYRLYTYTAGTTTHKNIYTESTGTTAHTYTSDGAGGQYIALNARGELPAPIFLGAGSYDFALKTAAGASIWTRNVPNSADISGTGGAALVGLLRDEANAVATTVEGYVEAQELNVVADYGADPTSGSDQTAKVQDALDDLPARGGTVIVPRGVKFARKTLTRPQRSVIRFYMDDDTSTSTAETYFSALATNEIVTDIANANASGVVNEERIQSRLHTGFVIDVLGDDDTHDAYLGAGQSRLNPKRASYNILDEGMDWWRAVTEHYADGWSQYSATSLQAWCPRITLAGITSASYSPAPSVNDLIIGNTSGARGYFISADGSQTIVAWAHGVFQTGETVNYGPGLNTADTISSRTASTAIGQPIMFNHHTGAIAIGGPPGNVGKTLGLWGDVEIARTIDFSQRKPETTTHPALWFTDSHTSPSGGLGISYDTTPAAASRRLRLRLRGESTMRAMVGAVQAKTAFSHSALTDTSALNIASISNTATGKYTVTFTTALARADYAVSIGNGDIADFSRYKNVATGSVEIWNYNSSGTLTNLVGQVSVVCTCGDI